MFPALSFLFLAAWLAWFVAKALANDAADEE